MSQPVTHSISSEIDELVMRFHAQKPIRAWSLIITIFGDCVAHRGGEIWLGTLTQIMNAMNIGSGVVRTAMSRLAADGWIISDKVGRNAFYRLSDMGEREMAKATHRIYEHANQMWDGTWTIAVLSATDDRPISRKKLQHLGYGVLATNVLIKPGHETTPGSTSGVMYLRCESSKDIAAFLGEEAWNLQQVSFGYDRFITEFENLSHALADEKQLSQQVSALDALIVRILLIHNFRKPVLRDPGLPQEVWPTGWPGTKARDLAAGIYCGVKDHGESWLDEHGKNAHGTLPAPETEFFHRFSSY
ncbi:MAG: phenylacetic acid degradation operon negative regulatory protein PaaX [Cohaesibacteraceae bacterium]|nr:phenylacetic acid degradation operon negative regulatory protein PaaX [Cohaesibacteraceae bacterium]